MIDKETYKKYTSWRKLKISIKTLSMERAFFTGLYTSLGFLFLFILAIYVLANKTVTTPKYNTSINIYSSVAPGYMSSFYASSPIEQFINGLTSAGLQKESLDGTFSPDIAEEIVKSEDGLTIEVKIKANAKFSNGEEIKSEDVLFSYLSILDPRVKAANKVLYEGVEFEKIDDKNFSIHLKKPYARTDEILTLGIMQKSLWENENTDQYILSKNNQISSGSGIYYIDSITLAESGEISTLTLKSNPYYQLNRPFVRQITFNVYKTDGELAQHIADEKVDMVFNAEKILEETNLKLQNIEMPRVTSIYLNPNKNKSFGDKNVRRAIYEIINRGEVVNKILKNAATPAFDILPGSQIKTNYVFFTEEELAKALSPVASSTVHLAITTSERQQRLAVYLKDLFFKYNINLEVQTFEANTLLQNEIKNRDFEMLLFTTEIESNYDLYAFLHSSQRNSPGLNITGYTSKTLDAEIDSIKSATNTLAIYDSILNIRDEFYKEYFYIPIYTPYSLMYLRDGLNINLPSKIQTYKNIFSDTENFYNETENVWTITTTEQSKKIIRIIYKILH